MAYWRAFDLPLISDDYLQIALGRKYGPVQSWTDLAADPLYRCRATSILLTHWVEYWFGLNAIATNALSLMLHVVNTVLLAGLSIWRRIPPAVAFAAAVFFAVYEGHQEAVIWFAAIPELLVFLFALMSFLAWVKWAQDETSRPIWLVASIGAFVLALLSKESAVALTGVIGIVALLESNRVRNLLSVVPFAILSGGYTLLSLLGKTDNQHYQDGTFALSAPFLSTVSHSMARMMWFWGIVAAIVLLRGRGVRSLKVLAPMAAAAMVTLLPYSFLTYMSRVPSRHTYLASAVLALLVGFAWVTLRGMQVRRWMAPALAGLLLAHNCGYIWIKKYPQYLKRAEPTEKLVEFSRSTPGPIHVRCFPYAPVIAVSTLVIDHNRPEHEIHTEAPPETVEAADFCYEESKPDALVNLAGAGQ
ncbi:MAG: hypothetical protein IT168_23610 [Bryobacterales bacterium]|nr:hypothetical protein [Bryobacterales bacterium]